MTAINPDFTVKPLARPQAGLPFVDDRGMLTDVGRGFLNELRDFVSGTNRIIPCNASGKNLITLTPANETIPILRYQTFDFFTFRGDITSDASVTMTVVPKTGALATVKAYVTAGAAQAGAGDIVADSVYIAIFAEHLDSNSGGFVIK